jgi:hypothetical protein
MKHNSIEANVRREFPPRPGGRYEEELVRHEVDWDNLHNMAVGSQVMLCLIGCARVLAALVAQHKRELPVNATVSAEIALSKLGEVS